MEFVAVKKSKNRKRNRNVKNKRRLRRKLEVKASARRGKPFNQDISAMKDESRTNTMDAHAFWENYKIAQDWQQRHSVAWWKSRCHALEHENNILRQKVRSQASQGDRQIASKSKRKMAKVAEVKKDPEMNENENENDDDNEDNENLVFQVDKDMMEFLAQSIRHKIELKRSREMEKEAAVAEENADIPYVTCEARIIAKTEDARLLYGDASPGIMAMEAALQATMDRQKDRANPHYWPNIPLKP